MRGGAEEGDAGEVRPGVVDGQGVQGAVDEGGAVAEEVEDGWSPALVQLQQPRAHRLGVGRIQVRALVQGRPELRVHLDVAAAAALGDQRALDPVDGQ